MLLGLLHLFGVTEIIQQLIELLLTYASNAALPLPTAFTSPVVCTISIFRWVVLVFFRRLTGFCYGELIPFNSILEPFQILLSPDLYRLASGQNWWIVL